MKLKRKYCWVVFLTILCLLFNPSSETIYLLLWTLYIFSNDNFFCPNKTLIFLPYYSLASNTIGSTNIPRMFNIYYPYNRSCEWSVVCYWHHFTKKSISHRTKSYEFYVGVLSKKKKMKVYAWANNYTRENFF